MSEDVRCLRFAGKKSGLTLTDFVPLTFDACR